MNGLLTGYFIGRLIAMLVKGICTVIWFFVANTVKLIVAILRFFIEQAHAPKKPRSRIVFEGAKVGKSRSGRSLGLSALAFSAITVRSSGARHRPLGKRMPDSS